MIRSRTIFILVVVVSIVFVFARCMNKTKMDPRGNMYAGSQACIKCHPAIASSFLHTAHYLSTRPAGLASVRGSFEAGRNQVAVSPDIHISMEKNDRGLFQTLYVKDKAVDQAKFELVMGSVKGQSFIYRKQGAFFELPVSWFSFANHWVISPGFQPTSPRFDRPVTRRCFECHSSWVSENAASDSSQAVWNIDCERCHGPAAVHVDFHTNHPGETAGHNLAAIQQLSREQKIALCATCHAGTAQTLLRSTFGFLPGDSLARYMIPDFTGTLPVDVHGNQVGALKKSRCYAMSNLDCATCHNVHTTQRGENSLFNSICTNCHNTTAGKQCPLINSLDSAMISNNCTRCHMPAQPSRVIRMSGTDGESLSALIVNHRIAVYPEQGEALMGHKKDHHE